MMISYGKQSVSQEDVEEVIKVLKSNFLTQGEKVQEFESSLNRYFGSKYSIAVSNGTAALHLAGIALGWNESDVVITSPITFLSTVNSIIYSGSTPDFVDIDPLTYCLDVNKLEEKLKFYQSQGKRVKSVIGVDFAGHPCDWNSINQLSKKYGFTVVNDNCHAFGASYYGDKKYACNFADLVTQSYHPVKNITTGEGGAVLTNDSSMEKRIRTLRAHGMEKDTKLQSLEGSWYYEMNNLGFNYRLTDIQCALGISQLKKLDTFINKRREIAKNYDNFFKADKSFTVPIAKENIQHAYHLYCLQFDFIKARKTKKDFFMKAEESGIRLQVHYLPVHLQPFYRKKFGYSEGDFPISEGFYEKTFSIPIYPDLKSSEQEHVYKTIKELL